MSLAIDDNPREHIGANFPGEFEAVRDSVEERLAAFLKGLDIWDGRKDFDDELAEKANDFLTGVQRLRSEADKARLAETKPHRDATASVNAWWEERLTKLDKIKAKVLAPLDAYAKRKKAEADEARRQAEQRAAEAAEALRLAELEAATARTASQQIEAEARAETAAAEADAAAKQAERAAEPARIASATGAGRTRSLRRERKVSIDSLPMALAYFMKDPAARAAIHDLIERLANAHVRGLGVDTPLAQCRIDGCTITESEKL